MSDIYEVLRRRVDVVAEWVELGVDRMSEAQTASGLSDEKAARQVPVATRTWIRWKKRGAVPVHSLVRVAEILDLQIEKPVFDRYVATRAGSDSSIESRLTRIEEQLEDVLARLERMADDPRETAA